MPAMVVGWTSSRESRSKRQGVRVNAAKIANFFSFGAESFLPAGAAAKLPAARRKAHHDLNITVKR